MHFLTFIIIIFCTGENDLEAKYQRSILDIAVLQDHLGEEPLWAKNVFCYFCFIHGPKDKYISHVLTGVMQMYFISMASLKVHKVEWLFTC